MLEDIPALGTRIFAEFFYLRIADVSKNTGTHQHGIQSSRLRAQNIVIDVIANADYATTVGDTNELQCVFADFRDTVFQAR